MVGKINRLLSNIVKDLVRVKEKVDIKPTIVVREEVRTDEETEEDDVEAILRLVDVGEELEMEDVPLKDVVEEIVHVIPEDIASDMPAEWKPPDLTSVDERYPLIPPHAYAHVYWSDGEKHVVYDVEEPALTLSEKQELERIKNILIDVLEMAVFDFSSREMLERYISTKFEEIVRDYGIKLTDYQKDKLKYYLIRDFVGLSKIEPLMRDPLIEDISCIGPSIPVYVYHRNYGSLRTNVVFRTQEELNKFIIRLAQLAGKHVSVYNPLLHGSLPDGSRVQATYVVSRDISTKGSNFTIRKFTKDPLTVTDLVRFGTITSRIAAYFWLAVEYRNSFLISGGTASGKTTLLNVLSMFIPPNAKIVTIEDTPELRLAHENWLQKVARESDEGAVTMFDLLKAALRERPDYIVVGEVRGKEAYILFQGMATGHPGLATIHAENMETLVDRLITPPINLPPSLLHSLDVIVFMGRFRRQGIFVRRVKEIHEVTGVDIKEKRPITNLLIEWIPPEDKFRFVSRKSRVVDKIVNERGVKVESVWEEIRRREKVIDYMVKNNIRYYRDVQMIIKRYYTEPEVLLEEISRGSG